MNGRVEKPRGTGPMSLKELKELCAQRGLPVSGNKATLLDRLGGRAKEASTSRAPAARPVPHAAPMPRCPPGKAAAREQEKAGRYVVWYKAEYPPDGFHSFHPGEVCIDSVHATKAAANEAVKVRFFENNVWGLGPDEMEEEDIHEDWEDGLLTVSVCPDDSEEFTVGVKLAQE